MNGAIDRYITNIYIYNYCKDNMYHAARCKKTQRIWRDGDKPKRFLFQVQKCSLSSPTFLFLATGNLQ